jgi:kinesin family protein C1
VRPVQDLTIRQVSTNEDIHSLMAQAAHCRSSAETAMNETSSRSHCVFTLRLYGDNPNCEGGGSSSTEGVLHLIDLAGSERLSRR